MWYKFITAISSEWALKKDSHWNANTQYVSSSRYDNVARLGHSLPPMTLFPWWFSSSPPLFNKHFTRLHFWWMNEVTCFCTIWQVCDWCAEVLIIRLTVIWSYEIYRILLAVQGRLPCKVLSLIDINFQLQKRLLVWCAMTISVVVPMMWSANTIPDLDDSFALADDCLTGQSDQFKSWTALIMYVDTSRLGTDSWPKAHARFSTPSHRLGKLPSPKDRFYPFYRLPGDKQATPLHHILLSDWRRLAQRENTQFCLLYYQSWTVRSYALEKIYNQTTVLPTRNKPKAALKVPDSLAFRVCFLLAVMWMDVPYEPGEVQVNSLPPCFRQATHRKERVRVAPDKAHHLIFRLPCTPNVSRW